MLVVAHAPGDAVHDDAEPVNRHPELLAASNRVVTNAARGVRLRQEQGSDRALGHFSSRPQIGKHDINDVTAALGHVFRGAQVAPEDRRKRVAIGEIEEAQRGDGDVQLHWIDTPAENAGFSPPLRTVESMPTSGEWSSRMRSDFRR